MRSVLCALAVTSAVAQNPLGILIGDIFDTNSKVATVPLNTITNVASLALGVPPVLSADQAVGATSAAVSGRFTKRARANVLVAVPAVGADAIDRYGLSNLQALRRDHVSVGVSMASANVYDFALSLSKGSIDQSEGANLADVVAQTFEGRSLTLSASSSDALANLFMTNPSLAGSNDFCMCLTNGSFSSSKVGAPAMDRATISNSVQQLAKQTGVELTNVNTALLAELVYALSVPTLLSSHPAVSDETPDTYTFVLNGVAQLADMRGLYSEEFVNGLRVLDATLPLILENFNAAYNNNMAAELVLFGSPVQGVSGFSRRLMQIPNDTNNTNNTYPSDAEVVKFHIVLWVSIGLSFATLFAVYSIGGMNFKKDTLLYSSFNPKWEGGDARKHR